MASNRKPNMPSSDLKRAPPFNSKEWRIARLIEHTLMGYSAKKVRDGLNMDKEEYAATLDAAIDQMRDIQADIEVTQVIPRRKQLPAAPRAEELCWLRLAGLNSPSHGAATFRP